MSYLRAPFYVWGDGSNVHIWLREADELEDGYVAACQFPRGVQLPLATFDALCLMRAAEIEERRGGRRYTERLLRCLGGNYGAGALYRRLGQTPPWEQPVPVETEGGQS